MRRASNAFTLIETLAVIALMAVITAAVAVSLSSMRRKADLDGVAERFVAHDRSTREIARRFGRRPSLRFELHEGTVGRSGDTSATDSGAGASRVAPLSLGGARVAKLIVRGEAISYGEAAVPFYDAGRSPSYAVLLTNRAGERWVAFAGLTGQAIVSRDERQVREILSGGTTAPADEPAASARADAR